MLFIIFSIPYLILSFLNKNKQSDDRLWIYGILSLTYGIVYILWDKALWKTIAAIILLIAIFLFAYTIICKKKQRGTDHEINVCRDIFLKSNQMIGYRDLFFLFFTIAVIKFAETGWAKYSLPLILIAAERIESFIISKLHPH